MDSLLADEYILAATHFFLSARRLPLNNKFHSSSNIFCLYDQGLYGAHTLERNFLQVDSNSQYCSFEDFSQADNVDCV